MINLTENGEILGTDTYIAETLNDYLSNVVQNLNIPRENMDLSINPVSTGGNREIQTFEI